MDMDDLIRNYLQRLGQSDESVAEALNRAAQAVSGLRAS